MELWHDTVPDLNIRQDRKNPILLNERYNYYTKAVSYTHLDVYKRQAIYIVLTLYYPAIRQQLFNRYLLSTLNLSWMP